MTGFGLTVLSIISLLFLGPIAGWLYYHQDYSRSEAQVEPSRSTKSVITQLPLEGRSILTIGDITVILDRSLPKETINILLDRLTDELYGAPPTSIWVVTTGDRKRNFVSLAKVMIPAANTPDKTRGMEPGADYQQRLNRENGELLFEAVAEAKNKYSTLPAIEVTEGSLYRAMSASLELLRLDTDEKSREKSVYVLTDLDKSDIGKSTNRINNNGINVILIIPRWLITGTVTSKEDVRSRFTDPDRIIYLLK